MRPDRTFYDLIPPAYSLIAPDNFSMGIVEPNGFLRPFFYHGTMVKVRRHGPGNFEIIPLTLQEYVIFRYNHDITPFHEGAAEYVVEERNRQRGSRDG